MSLLETAQGLVAKVMPTPAPDPLIGADRVIGRSIPRLDGPLKVAGQARFSGEVRFDGMVYAALALSTIAQGRIVSIDTTDAEASPGVLHVMTHLNAPRMAAPPRMLVDPDGAMMSQLPIMQDAAIHWNGEPVAVVAAATQEQADHAAGLIRVTYAEAAASLSFDRAKAGAVAPPDVLGQPAEIRIGEAEVALKTAAVSVDHVYTTPRHAHAAIEPHAVTVAWQDGKLIVHDSSQMLHLTAATFAKVFGIPVADVHVMSPYVGGGFGSKIPWSHHFLAIAIARAIGRPVRLTLSREGVFRITGGRTPSEQRVALGARPDGTLAALIHTGITAQTAHNDWPEQFSFAARHLYAADAMLIGQTVVELDSVANCAMRAPGESIGTFALESALDELSYMLAIDPIELRRRIEPAQDPTTGQPFSERNLLKAYNVGAERFGWSARSSTPRSRREGEWWIGHGVATALFPYFRMPGGRARIRLRADGRATAEMGSHEMGMGTATVQAQHLAERLGLPLEKAAFVYGDTDLPTGTMAGGSSQTATIVAAVRAAADVLVADLIKLAGNDSPLAGLKASEVVARDEGLCAIDHPAKCESYASILSRAGRDEVVAEADPPPPLEMMQFSMFSLGAQFAEVAVSEISGEVRVRRFLGSFDVGRVLNPQTATSQLRGGIIMGLGMALTEDALFDARSGRTMNPSLAEYHVPSHADVPDIDVIWTGIPDPNSPLGLRGVGEIGITGVAAAVANAVYNATGKRVRDLPVTLDKLL